MNRGGPSCSQSRSGTASCVSSIGGTALLFLGNFILLDGEDKLHAYAGYAVLTLVLLRLVWGLVGSRHARFSAFRPSLMEAKAHLTGLFTGRTEIHLSHNPLGALMVYSLLAALLLVCASGLMLESDAFWGVAWVEEFHEIVADYALVCVSLHVAGVILETRRSGVNLVMAMLTGRKEIPKQRS